MLIAQTNKVPDINCSYLFSSYISVEIYVIISVIFLILFSIYIFKTQLTKFSAVGLLLVWFGGLHNLYHRVRYICVTDALSFFGLFSFNLADAAVTLGILFFIYNIFIWQKKSY